MFSWLRRTRLPASLAGISQPTLVCVPVSIASENLIVSPATGVRCALLRWSFFYGRTQHRNKSGAAVTRWERWCGGELGSSLLATTSDGVAITFPTPSSVRLELRGDLSDMMPITHEIAQAFPDVIAQSSVAAGQLGYNEIYLMKGDRLQLKGVVAPLSPGVFEVVGDGPIKPELIEAQPFV